MKTLFLIIAVLILQANFSASGQGFIYDQQSSDESNSGEGASYIQLLQPMGQSFTPTNSSMNFVRLILFDGRQNNDLGATIYVNLWSGSISNGTLLSSTTPIFLTDNFGTGSNGVVDFFFPTSVPLTPGTVYYFQPVVQSGDIWGAASDIHFNYAGGAAYSYGAVNPSWDLWFREGVYSVPEPSSIALGVLGISGLFVLSRRKH